MMELKKSIVAILLVAFLLCATTSVVAQTTTGQVQNNVLQAAAEEGNLRMFTGAVDTAGLRDTLSGSGPYTILAPRDNAFMNIPSPEMDALSKDPSKMAAVINNHVIPGKYTIKDLRNQGYVNTLGGKRLKVSSSNGAFAVDGAQIVKNDIPAGNGIVHVIDTVMIPK